MTEHNVKPSGEGGDVQVWEPEQALRRMSSAEVALSRGFLRCRPEKWFPGFAARWLPVIHALGFEVRLNEIKPLLAKPPLDGVAFVGSIGGEDVVVATDRSTANSLTEELLPGGDSKAAGVVLEYLFRRFLSTLAISWSAGEGASVKFSRGVRAEEVRVAGSIRLTFTVNTVPVTMWVGLGAKMVETLDGLWRRQAQSLSKTAPGQVVLRLELGQLGVPPQMLSEYLTKGTVIDLEMKASDSVTIKVGHKLWMPARLVDVEGFYGCEMTPGALAVPSIAEGATQLCVELGVVTTDATKMAELAQAGSVLLSDIPTTASVDLVINQEKIGAARLCVYEGRFAIEVL